MSTPRERLLGWLLSVSGGEWLWFAKRLAANDTLATHAHQAGPYMPKEAAFSLFPSLVSASAPNPRSVFEAFIDSHAVPPVAPSMIWYNNFTRDECRMTGWGGRRSPVLDPDSTGALCLFAFSREESSDADTCRVWLCQDPQEEEEVEDRIGVIDPGTYFFGRSVASGLTQSSSTTSRCVVTFGELPPAWRTEFPPAEEIVSLAATIAGRAVQDEPPDSRLLRRRECEFRIFRLVEDAVVVPRLADGFRTVDDFVSYANSVTNRRKARAGMSLELHASAIFEEERLEFSHGDISEGAKRPDFLFPSVAAYRNSNFPSQRLRMLAAKTTCKDRWRQILNEADRIPNKHLLTLQEGVSENQFEEMSTAGVTLVVPKTLHDRYPRAVRSHLLDLTTFIQQTRAVSGAI